MSTGGKELDVETHPGRRWWWANLRCTGTDSDEAAAGAFDEWWWLLRRWEYLMDDCFECAAFFRGLSSTTTSEI